MNSIEKFLKCYKNPLINNKEIGFTKNEMVIDFLVKEASGSCVYTVSGYSE